MRKCQETRRTGQRWSASVMAAALLLMAGQTGAEPPCRFKVPADLDAAPARWLGECGKGTAEGLGILRAGTGEPYAFFAGRMKGGLPVHGLLMLRSGGWMVPVRFDGALRTVSQDGLHPEQDDRVFADAEAAARATAARLRRTGNATSAAYYVRLARQIVDGRPE